MHIHDITKETCVVRNTASKKGRQIAIEPGTSPLRHLQYGRIILDAGDAAVHVNNDARETGLIALKGSAAVVVGAETFRLERLDSLYVPRDNAFEVSPGPSGCDLAEIGAAVDRAYPLQFVPFKQVQQNPGLHFKVGSAATERDLSILLGKNIQAGRILAGVTYSGAGGWTSWPPHEHAAMLEEAYLYIDMPAPSFGLQLVYTNAKEPELVTVVREGDVVILPKGYHPNVAAPGGSINFLWMMAANREGEDRQYGVVNVQPEFANIPLGIDRGR